MRQARLKKEGQTLNAILHKYMTVYIYQKELWLNPLSNLESKGLKAQI